MLEGLADEEVDRYLEEYSKTVPLFEVDITEVVIPYVTNPIKTRSGSYVKHKNHWKEKQLYVK